MRESYIGLVQAARATGKIQTTDPEQAVDIMLATMEGIKLQAHYNPRLCNPESEKAIVQSLQRALGFPDAKTGRSPSPPTSARPTVSTASSHPTNHEK